MTVFDMVTIVGACLIGLCIIAVFSAVTIIAHQIDHKKIDAELERYYDQLNRKAEHEGLPDAPESDVIDVTNYAEEEH